MIQSEYRTNRASFPRAEFEKYRGRWVAFTEAGTTIIASGLTEGTDNSESADRLNAKSRLAGVNHAA